MFWSHPLCPCFIFVCFEHSFTLHNTPHEHHVMAKKKKQLNFLLKERPYESCLSTNQKLRENKKPNVRIVIFGQPWKMQSRRGPPNLSSVTTSWLDFL